MTMKLMYYSLIAFTGMLIVQPTQAMLRSKPVSSVWEAFKKTSTGTKVAVGIGAVGLTYLVIKKLTAQTTGQKPAQPQTAADTQAPQQLMLQYGMHSLGDMLKPHTQSMPSDVNGFAYDEALNCLDFKVNKENNSIDIIVNSATNVTPNPAFLIAINATTRVVSITRYNSTISIPSHIKQFMKRRNNPDLNLCRDYLNITLSVSRGHQLYVTCSKLTGLS